jgi:hypothetical protein
MIPKFALVALLAVAVFAPAETQRRRNRSAAPFSAVRLALSSAAQWVAAAVQRLGRSSEPRPEPRLQPRASHGRADTIIT